MSLTLYKVDIDSRSCEILFDGNGYLEKGQMQAGSDLIMN